MDAQTHRLIEDAQKAVFGRTVQAASLVSTAIAWSAVIQARAGAEACLLMEAPWTSPAVIPDEWTFEILEEFAPDGYSGDDHELTPEESCLFLLFAAEALLDELKK